MAQTKNRNDFEQLNIGIAQIAPVWLDRQRQSTLVINE